ncbi:hypothetical protein [Kamptonema sp. UHCC 0994]|uniref:hypothetical protein n=1 Tax=Kamptonema sp. UHCC 0994 TaxID=3031329 RepID=UPI0023B980D5|nr:hypothetical protein [Kamptonema sp. UHCC 0994]MDF0554968.1 hypothetical protein [Kamptonema sp. UHCC 0994]
MARNDKYLTGHDITGLQTSTSLYSSASFLSPVQVVASYQEYILLELKIQTYHPLASKLANILSAWLQE